MRTDPDTEREGLDFLLLMRCEVVALPVLNVAHPCGEIESQRKRRRVFAVDVVRGTRLPPRAVIMGAKAKPNERRAKVERRTACLREVEVIDLRANGRIQR
jgi:hypothetical protein